MKKNYFILMLICWVSGMYGQNYYYYYKNQQQSLSLDKTGLDIYVNNSFQTQSVSNINIESINLGQLSANKKTVEIVDAKTFIKQ